MPGRPYYMLAETLEDGEAWLKAISDTLRKQTTPSLNTLVVPFSSSPDSLSPLHSGPPSPLSHSGHLLVSQSGPVPSRQETKRNSKERAEKEDIKADLNNKLPSEDNTKSETERSFFPSQKPISSGRTAVALGMATMRTPPSMRANQDTQEHLAKPKSHSTRPLRPLPTSPVHSHSYPLLPLASPSVSSHPPRSVSSNSPTVPASCTPQVSDSTTTTPSASSSSPSRGGSAIAAKIKGFSTDDIVSSVPSKQARVTARDTHTLRTVLPRSEGAICLNSN